MSICIFATFIHMDEPLNLPEMQLKTKQDLVWDEIRKKYVKCSPEEWVRQNFINYLINHLNYPKGRMVVEYKVVYNAMNKRCDIAVFGTRKKVEVIVECKAPKIQITEDTFYQIAKYAHVLNAPLLILTNGLEHYCALINSSKNELTYLEKIPEYSALQELIN